MTAAPAIAAESRRRLRVVAGAKVGRVRVLPAVVMALALVLAFFAIIFSHARLTESSFELEELSSAIELEQARFEELRLDVARLSSPARIGPEAERLGMVLPDPAALRPITATMLSESNHDDAAHWASVKPIVTAAP